MVSLQHGTRLSFASPAFPDHRMLLRPIGLIDARDIGGQKNRFASGPLRFAALTVPHVTRSPLHGLSLLVVEDHPLIAMDITQAFESVGAHITTTNTLRHAMNLAEHDGLSAAILDHALGDASSEELYARLKDRGIPFLIYSGFSRDEGLPPEVPVITKPATHEELISALEQLVRANPHRLLDPLPETLPRSKP